MARRLAKFYYSGQTQYFARLATGLYSVSTLSFTQQQQQQQPTTFLHLCPSNCQTDSKCWAWGGLKGRVDAIFTSEGRLFVFYHHVATCAYTSLIPIQNSQNVLDVRPVGLGSRLDPWSCIRPVRQHRFVPTVTSLLSFFLACFCLGMVDGGGGSVGGGVATLSGVIFSDGDDSDLSVSDIDEGVIARKNWVLAHVVFPLRDK